MADVSEDLGEAAVEALARAGAKAVFLPVDLADPKSIEAFAEKMGRATAISTGW